MVLGTQASGITALGRTVFSSLGIAVKPIPLEKAADGPAMLLDGRAEGLWGAGVGWPAFAELAKAGARFIGPSEREIAAILQKNPALQAVTLPAKSYPGQDAPIPSVGSSRRARRRSPIPRPPRRGPTCCIRACAAT